MVALHVAVISPMRVPDIYPEGCGFVSAFLDLFSTGRARGVACALGAPKLRTSSGLFTYTFVMARRRWLWRSGALCARGSSRWACSVNVFEALG